MLCKRKQSTIGSFFLIMFAEGGGKDGKNLTSGKN